MDKIEEYLEKAANKAKVKALIELYSSYNSELKAREKLFEQIVKNYALIKNEESVELTIEFLYEKLKSENTKLARKLLSSIDSIVDDTKKNYEKLINSRKELPELTLDLILNTQDSYCQLILPIKREDTNEGKIFKAIYEKFKNSITEQDSKVKEEYFNDYLSFKTSKDINRNEISKSVNKDTLLDTAKIKFTIKPYKLQEIEEIMPNRYIEITLPESITKKKPAWQRFGILPVDTKQCIKTSDPDLKLKEFFPKQRNKFVITDRKGYEFETWQDSQGRINTGMTEFYRKNKVQSGSVLRLEEIEHHKKYTLNIVK